jgi:hypothetical protein
MDEDQVEYEGVWDREWLPIDALVLGLNFIAGVAEAAAETLTAARCIVAAHANHISNMRRFHQQAAQAIERLTSGDE